MKYAFSDLIRLAYKNGGIIPKSIPSHYVKHCYNIHRQSKGLVIPTLEYSRIRDGVIYLPKPLGFVLDL